MIESLCNTCEYNNDYKIYQDDCCIEKLCEKDKIIFKQNNLKESRNRCLGCGEYKEIIIK